MYNLHAGLIHLGIPDISPHAKCGNVLLFISLPKGILV